MRPVARSSDDARSSRLEAIPVAPDPGHAAMMQFAALGAANCTTRTATVAEGIRREADAREAPPSELLGQPGFERVLEVEHGLAPELALDAARQRVVVADVVVEAHAGAEIAVLGNLVVVV